MLETAEFRKWIEQEIRLAMQEETAHKLDAPMRAKVAEIRAGRIIAKLKGYPTTDLDRINPQVESVEADTSTIPRDKERKSRFPGLASLLQITERS